MSTATDSTSRHERSGARMGFSWFEQKKAGDGSRTFVEHLIMGDCSTANAGDVTFSERHGSASADVDGNGLQDFITGKRFRSHLDTFIDPDPHGAPVLYVYRAVLRDPKAPDGAPEIITATKRGTFIFWNNWKAARKQP
jgi:hypothetical protein